MRSDNQNNKKKYIAIVDAVLCGEGNGPKIPDPKKLNYLIQGSNPAVVDAVCAELMGFDYQKIPVIKNAFRISKFSIVSCAEDDILVKFSDAEYKLQEIPESKKSLFIASNGWINHIEK